MGMQGSPARIESYMKRSKAIIVPPRRQPPHEGLPVRVEDLDLVSAAGLCQYSPGWDCAVIT